MHASSFKHIAEAVSEIGPYTRFIVAVLDSEETMAPVAPPSLTVTSDIVERALADAEQLLRTQGPASALDRVHTALHGYLRVHLDEAGLEGRDSRSLTGAFKVLRTAHPKLQETGDHGRHVLRLLKTLATVVDSLNTLRNTASAAHPNETLLGDAEAMLAINCGRTLLHYLDSKLGR